MTSRDIAASCRERLNLERVPADVSSGSFRDETLRAVEHTPRSTCSGAFPKCMCDGPRYLRRGTHSHGGALDRGARSSTRSLAVVRCRPGATVGTSPVWDAA